MEHETFPFEPCIISKPSSNFDNYLKGRFWFLFKYFKKSLSKRNYNDFKRGLIDHKITIVHAHFGTNGTLIAPLCKELNIPLIVTFHGFDVTSVVKRWPGYRKELRNLFIQIKYAIAISEDMAITLKSLGCPAEKIKVCYLGVPVDEFKLINRESRSGPLRFLHAGRLTPKKGVPDLVKAFAQAFPVAGSAILDIAGDGEDKDQVIETIGKTNSQNSINVLGALNKKDIIAAMQKADVFVANCRTDLSGTKEGLPIAILEAASTGLPVISTVHAGIPEAVQNNVTGILVSERNIIELTQAMITLQERTVALKMGIAGRKLMEDKFSIHSCNEKLYELYKSCL
jgi:glycosyltransferase involved in cell wall biosynthesis